MQKFTITKTNKGASILNGFIPDRQTQNDKTQLQSVDGQFFDTLSTNNRRKETFISHYTSVIENNNTANKGIRTKQKPFAGILVNQGVSLFMVVFMMITGFFAMLPSKGFSQINIVEGFELTTTPAGWVYVGFSRNTTTPCNGVASLRRNFWSSNQTGNVQTQTWISLGYDLAISFNYKIINFEGGGATPNVPAWGELFVEVSTNGGANYNFTAGSINPGNHTPSANCTNVTYTVPGALLTVGSTLRVRFRGQWAGGDYFIYIDNVALTQIGQCDAFSNPGSPCEDGNSFTTGGYYNDNCNCVGTIQDCSGTHTSGLINLAIPDGNLNGVNHTITIADEGIITQLNCVNLNISHNWVGDLSVTLTHQESGKSVQLFRRVGNGVYGSGANLAGNYSFCIDGQDFQVVAAGLNVNQNIPAGVYQQGASGDPLNPPANPNTFDIFTGEQLAGDWTLNITDWEVDYGGILIEWSFETCVVAHPSPCGMNLAIPDNGCQANNYLESHIAISGLNNSLGTNVQLSSVDLITTHTYNGDLNIYLVSPNGVQRHLVFRRGGFGDNFGNPANCPEAVFRLQDGGAHPNTISGNNVTGVFAPEQSLAGFNDGSNPNGNWTIRICDAANGDVGALQYIALNFINCISPDAYITVSDVCPQGQFFLEVNLNHLGSASSVNIETSIGDILFNISSPGVYGFGEYDFNTPIGVIIVNNDNSDCSLNLGFYTSFGSDCPLTNPSACGLNLSIPDNGCSNGIFLEEEIYVAGQPAALGNDVILQSVDIITTHTWNGDLNIYLVSPNGVQRHLVFRRGSNWDNFGNPANCPEAVLRLQDDGAHPNTITGNNVTGVFAPEQSLAGFNDGSNPNGIWTVRICDAASGDVGALQYIALNFALVCSNPIDGGLIAGDQTVCEGEAVQQLVNNTLPSGHMGILEYQWQSSTSLPAFEDIVGANSVDYTPPLPLNQTTWFRRLAKVTCEEGWNNAVSSNVIEVVVEPVTDVFCLSDHHFCVQSGIVFLEGLPGIFPPSLNINSSFSGPGVTPFNPVSGLWDFDPFVAGVGSHEITYTYVGENGCPNSCTFIINVYPNPGLPLADVMNDVGCVGATGADRAGVSVLLPNVPGFFVARWVIGNNPAGIAPGTEFDYGDVVPGILSFPDNDPRCVFAEPSAPEGVYEFCVRIRDMIFGCESDEVCGFSFTLLPLPEVSCPQSFILDINEVGVSLETLPGLSPPSIDSRSVFSGPGVVPFEASAGLYDFYTWVAGAGIHEITYQYTNDDGCTATCIFFIEVTDGNPVNLDLNNFVIGENDSECFGATQNITIHEVSVDGGGSLTLIAGNSIVISPEFSVALNGYFRAYISDEYCILPASLLAVESEVSGILSDDSFITLSNELRIFPNPTTGEFTVYLGENFGLNQASVTIYNLIGELIQKNEQVLIQAAFNLAGYPNGMYIVLIRNKESTEIRKLVKQ